jgi:molecular chaperone GrpE
LFRRTGRPNSGAMSIADDQTQETETAEAASDSPRTPPSDPIRALEAERDEFRDKWMRAEAEAQNIRNRAKRDVDETRAYAVQKFAKDVVEAAENIRRGIDSLPRPAADEPDIVAKLRSGFEGVERSFVGLLERNGIVADDPVGKPFDANLHQAMAEQVTAEHPPGTVIQAWSRAWTLNTRLLRPAMVVVAKAPPPPPEPEVSEAAEPMPEAAPAGSEA